MSSLDYMDVCRLCLVKDRVTVPIFEGEGNLRQIYLKISSCLQVKIAREDKLPQKICEECVYKVELFFDFWNQTLNVDKQLQQWLENVDKQGYAVATVLNQSGMKGEQSNENRLDGSVMQQVSGHQGSLNMGMDNIGVCMPMMMPNSNQQQITSVPMDTSGNSVQNVQVVAGSSAQTTHDQITQNQTNAPTQQEEEEESSEDEENSDDECDGDDGLPIKEESEEDPNNSRTIEPTTFVNVSLACEDPGPSGLQQQKMSDIQEMTQATDVDPKTGWTSAETDAMVQEEEVLCDALTWSHVTSPEVGQVEHAEESPSTEKVDSSAAARPRRRKRATSRAAPNLKKEKISCEICKITFNMPGSEYRKHMLKHSSHRAFQCDVCKKKFKHKINMNRHKTKVHGEAPLYSCQYCDFSTIHCSYLQVHFTRKHTDDFHFSCDKCDRKFRVKADYTKHLITHEGDPCICDVCGSALANKMALYFHKNYKHRVRDAKFQCPVCRKKLQTQKNLDSHVLQHEQRYMCEECGLELTRKASLKKHIKTHSGEKPYSCHICGKTFASATGRKVHLLTHLQARPYVCTICGQSFTQRPALSIHWKKKHPDVADAPPPVSIKSIIESIMHHGAKI